MRRVLESHLLVAVFTPVPLLLTALFMYLWFADWETRYAWFAAAADCELLLTPLSPTVLAL